MIHLDTKCYYLASLAQLLATYRTTPPATRTPAMESSTDHGRGLKPLPAWTTTTTPAGTGHSFSLAAGCFPWPPQRSSPPPSVSCYTCGYCRREFRSAQALGGHMNVHRRDRARLRQCCSASAAAHPSASLPSPALTARHQHSRAPIPNLNFSPQHCAAGGSMAAADPVIYSLFSTTTSSSTAVATKAAVEVSLELGIGVCGRSSGRGGGVVEDDGLDLELRLGCAWE
jgi:hypothetical protein